MKTIVFIILLSVTLLSRCQLDKSGCIDLECTPNQVELFAVGNVTTSLYERDIAISAGGDEIVFTLSDYKQSRRCLVIIKKIGNNWGKKEILSFSGQYNDIEPCFSIDGNRLYFASNRPIKKTSTNNDYNIWGSKRINNGWNEPEPLPPAINTDKDEFFPSISRNNNLYFTSVRENGIGNEDIFLSRYVDGMYLDPEPLDTNINTVVSEFNAYVSPDENLIIFSSYGRKDDIGGGDLYYSKKDKYGNWAKAVNMGPLINSDKLDYCPFIDIPRANFYFTSERTLLIEKRIKNVSELEGFANDILNGMGNIYRININKVLKND
jgi:hypothetical protein